MDQNGKENDNDMQLDVPDGMAEPPNTGQVGFQVVMKEFMQMTDGLNIPTAVGIRQTQITQRIMESRLGLERGIDTNQALAGNLNKKNRC